MNIGNPCPECEHVDGHINCDCDWCNRDDYDYWDDEDEDEDEDEDDE